MFEHERSLVRRMKGKPFVLLGINEDPDRDKLKQDIEARQVTWRSWWDGRAGPILRRWKVEYLPTTYVLDAKGVIRYSNPTGDDLDMAVDRLLKEIK